MPGFCSVFATPTSQKVLRILQVQGFSGVGVMEVLGSIGRLPHLQRVEASSVSGKPRTEDSRLESGILGLASRISETFIPVHMYDMKCNYWLHVILKHRSCTKIDCAVNACGTALTLVAMLPCAVLRFITSDFKMRNSKFRPNLTALLILEPAGFSRLGSVRAEDSSILSHGSEGGMVWR